MQSLLDDSNAMPSNIYEQPQESSSSMSSVQKSFGMRWQYILDKSSVYIKFRWSLFLFMLSLYTFRVYNLSGFYIVTYGLGIFLLNLFIGFLTPLDENDLSDSLPTSDEYKPFFRRLPEFKFWYACTKAVLVAFAMTFFAILDVPVFWPILVIYFFVLFAFTMKRQIQHMLKYRYLPFSRGKTNYRESGEDVRLV